MTPRPPLDELLALFQASVAREGTTTGAGAGAGNSIIDSGLIGIGANSFISMLMVVYPGDFNNVDSMDITAFNNVTGEVTLAGAYKGVAAAIPAGVPYKIVTFRFVPAEVAALTAIAVDIRTETDQLPNVEHETEWCTTAVVQQVANAAAVALTAGQIIPTFPTGSTRVRAILIASIHAANQAANTHHVDLKVQGQIDGGGYGDLLDLTAAQSLGMVNLDGAADGLAVAVDVTALVATSGATYDFRFQVDSDDAGAVNYTTSFVLVLVYTM